MPVPPAALALMFGATATDYGAVLSAEVAVGKAPFAATGTSESSLLTSVAPLVGARLYEPDWNVALRYSPRIHRRLPNALGLDRPLILHHAELTQSWQFDPRSALSSSYGLNLGEVDYTSISEVFDTAQSTTSLPVLQLVEFTSAMAVTHALSRRSEFYVEVAGSYSGPQHLEQRDLLPGRWLWSLKPGLEYKLTQFDSMGTAIQTSYQWFSSGYALLLVEPQLTWLHAFGPRTDFELMGGVAYVKTLDDQRYLIQPSRYGNVASETGNTEVSPIAAATLRSGTNVGTRARLDGVFRSHLEWYFDPILAESFPRLGAQLSLVLGLPPRWTIRADASFVTAATADPITRPTDEFTTDAVFTETLFMATLPISYRLSSTAGLELGGRLGTRGPHLSLGEFPSDSLEMWAYFGFYVGAAASNDTSWLGR